MDTNDKAFSALGYVGILFLIPLLAGKTEYTRFHANQGLVLFIADVVSGVVIGVVTGILSLIPFIGPVIAGIISGVLGLAIFVLMILGIVHAVQGEMKPLPVIGGFQIIK